MPLIDLKNKVKRLIQDEAGRLKSEELTDFILEALGYFSKDYPHVKIADIPGDGSYLYNLPSDWIEAVSWLRQVEYPVGKQIPVYLEADDYNLYKTPSGEKLRFLRHTPNAAETIRLTYTTPFTKTSLDNIPVSMQDALALLTAAICCETLSRSYAQNIDSGLEVDIVDFQSKSNLYAQRAKELQQRYNRLMGKQKGIGAATGVADWDVNYPWGEDRLNHPRKQR